LTAAALVHLGELVQARVHHALWPGQWPTAAQVVLAVLVAEFFMYWMHRSLHRVGYLWRFHAVHHSAERLYWVNANRVHPVETLIAYAPSFGVLVFLGAPPLVLGAWGALAGIHGIAQHMNTTVRPGRLNFLLSTPELHRWHHSRDRQYADGNYGSVTILWDLAFRTRVLPPQAHEPSDLGVGEAPAYVRGSLWRLLTAPFVTPWEAAPAPAQATDKSVR
jgi:sterol desaturase/sphingolipid hydroxylase (fatty acid hydroxylase superfamily)